MTDDLIPVTGRTGPIRVDVSPSVVPVASGSDAVITVEITNNDSVIRSLSVAVLGLDESWLTIPERDVALFPAERRAITVTCLLPTEFPSGARRAAIEVRDSMGDLVPALVEFDLLVDPVEEFGITLDPTSVIVGKHAAFTVAVRNNGNTTLEVELTGADPELILKSTFVPPRVLVYPDTVGVARIETMGKRPWFGTPQVRLLTVTATSGPTTTQATAAVMQRPIISRRILSLVGLLTAITVFTLVLAATFGNVARRANANAELIKQSLGGNDPASSGAAPAKLTGKVSSSTSADLPGVTVELFDVEKGPGVAVATTVTDDNGVFNFAAVKAGKYRVKFSAAGFADVWFPAAAAFEQGEDVIIDAEAAPPVLEAKLIGQPAIISGTVHGTDVVGATVLVRISADQQEPVSGVPPPPDGSELPGPVVQTVAVDAAGRFSIGNLPTPSDFELLAVKSGFTSRLRPVHLEPGEVLDDIVLDLVRGDGRITGTVVDPVGQPVGGATVDITDGTNASTTVTISSGVQAGTFELRNLLTPATYSLAISAPGYITQNITIRLESADSAPPLTVGLRSSVGTVSGVVLRAVESPGAPQLFGGVTVTVNGPAGFSRTTTSLTVGGVGTWKVTGLPLPGTYTVSFAAPGYTNEARGVELSPSNPINSTTGATLTTGLATLTGVVTEVGGIPAPGVTVEVSGAGVTRTTRTEVGTGRFGLSGLVPGAYSLTFRRDGSREVVFARNVVAGSNQVPDTVIEPEAGIYGTVTIGGVPTAGVELRIYLSSTYPLNPSSVVTGAGGTYKLVVAINTEQLYLVEVLQNNIVVDFLDPVAVGPGNPATGIDFNL